jgi:hypothetical protein
MSSKQEHPIQALGFWMFGFLSVVLAVLKLTVAGYWSYVAADHAGERRCLAAFMRARSIWTSPSLMSGRSAAMEARSSLY